MPYTPSQHVISSKAIGFSQGVPADARSYFYDATLFKYRPFQSVAEAVAYIDVASRRLGNFPVYISSGVLNPTTATFTGGVVTEWTFKDGTNDGNLVPAGSIDNTRIISSSTTVLPSDYVLFIKATTTNIIITLPSATANMGRVLECCRTDQTDLVVKFVSTDTAQKIDDNAELIVNYGSSFKLRSDGTSWWIF